MASIVFLNDQFIPLTEAKVSVNDRGYQFADGIYEVVYVLNNRFIDLGYHWQRLERSCQALEIPLAMTQTQFETLMLELARLNSITEGYVYFQITRGVWPRDHKYPTEAIAPTVLMTIKPKVTPDTLNTEGVKVITTKDLRWKRCDIKSISLLPNIMAKELAARAGAKEAFLIDENGYITEGSSTTAWIVTSQGTLQTRHLDDAILPGTARRAILEHVAPSLDLTVEEKPFHRTELMNAAEVFYTSTTQWVVPVIQVDEIMIGNGKPGPVTQRLFESYHQRAR